MIRRERGDVSAGRGSLRATGIRAGFARRNDGIDASGSATVGAGFEDEWAGDGAGTGLAAAGAGGRAGIGATGEGRGAIIGRVAAAGVGMRADAAAVPIAASIVVVAIGVVAARGAPLGGEMRSSFGRAGRGAARVARVGVGRPGGDGVDVASSAP